ncbi:hypothetical protein AY599_27095 [Leptolyngbya valderiana BDU 20041]|nr:hypothetical protein AY599_27095 [Leptolyngbya valderiana BDU 20041]
MQAAMAITVVTDALDELAPQKPSFSAVQPLRFLWWEEMAPTEAMGAMVAMQRAAFNRQTSLTICGGRKAATGGTGVAEERADAEDR